MEYRIPKVLEKTPVVWGYNLGKVAVIIFSAMGLLFVGYYNFAAALLFPAIGGTYIFIDNKFPAKGELTQFINYKTGNKCIHCDQSLRSLTNKITNMEETK